jgi:hypothetical protein
MHDFLSLGSATWRITSRTNPALASPLKERATHITIASMPRPAYLIQLTEEALLRVRARASVILTPCCGCLSSDFHPNRSVHVLNTDDTNAPSTNTIVIPASAFVSYISLCVAVATNCAFSHISLNIIASLAAVTCKGCETGQYTCQRLAVKVVRWSLTALPCT